MAYILTPRFAPAYQAPQCSPFGFCAPPSRSAYSFRPTQRPQPQPQRSPFASFFSQLDDLVSEIDRESQRQAQIEAQREAQRAAQLEAEREAYRAHVEAQQAAYRQRQAEIEAHIAAQREAHRQRQRQLRKRAFRAQFAVTQNEQGWQVDAELPGFEQGNINIELTDENTLKIAGNTEWGAKPQADENSITEATHDEEHRSGEPFEHPKEQITEDSAEQKMEGITLEPAAVFTPSETAADESVRPGTPDSDTSSHKSYQATVEDDFEDLGPEASTLFSTPSAPVTPSEPKGKEKAVEPAEDPEVSVPPETAVVQQPQAEVPAQQQEEERFHRSFERTYRFPERIDASNVRASLKEGVLSIIVPKAEAQPVKRIAIL